MAITAEVFHIYFHKMDFSVTTTSETINCAACHKQQHKDGYINATIHKMLHSKHINHQANQMFKDHLLN